MSANGGELSSDPSSDLSLELRSECFMLTDDEQRQLHVRRFNSGRQGPVMVLWPGLGESGQVFYPNERGLALELAACGFDVFVVDARGKGRSWPAVDEIDRCTVYSSLHEDIVQLCEFIEMECGVLPHVWLGHGAGVPFIGCALARFAPLRQATVGWIGIAPDFTGLSSMRAYWVFKVILPWFKKIPAGIVGPEPEWAGLFAEALRWSTSGCWVDSVDGLHYSDAWNHHRFPPAIMFAGSGDAIASREKVMAWIRSLRGQEAPVMVCQRVKRGEMLQSPYWTRHIAQRVATWFDRKQEMRVMQHEEEQAFGCSSFAYQTPEEQCSTTASE